MSPSELFWSGQLVFVEEVFFPVIIGVLIFVRVLPFAFLIAVLYTLMLMNRANEVVALKASGVSVFRIIRPFLCLAVILSLVSFIVNDRFVPAGIRTADTKVA